ncbi:hypothetical protein A2Z00_01225 [Candidatus Gottesmanbacteria bacterium RBG_13_45_10]|uniref:Uncharacterized protein n=1 Tax=Candidatus Gottesmanbacteria bacterium RBG_13_45_10 TaxID=1798370 RepID=A0A1F5ZFI1_9BACT|nr:MAG: hypothetical protein A2Z00_01225 [Candidatus Gottesmanbacteria bacterium RBG_13_45_10]
MTPIHILAALPQEPSSQGTSLQGTPLGRIGGTGLGPFGDITLDETSGIIGVTNVISSIIGVMTLAACIWFLFQILVSGYEWIAAGSDTKQMESARTRITHAFVGLIIVVGAWSLLAVAGQFFGFNTLIDPNQVIQLTPKSP